MARTRNLRAHQVDDGSLNTTPSPSSSSDKENQTRASRARSGKRTSDLTMAPPNLDTPSSNSSTNKRRRLTERQSNTEPVSQSQTRGSRSKEYYDPDQDEDERREVRKALRNLNRDLNDCRTEYMQPGNLGVFTAVEKSNHLMRGVKQTSDATVDSHFLVNAADLSYKKTAQLVVGDGSAGIDIDEYVSKCMSFMRRGPAIGTPHAPSGTQRRQPRRGDGDESDQDEGDALNWDWLGRSACFPHNGRPSLSGFLLGPLSVQKRTRQLTQRRARERIDPSQAVRPHELREEDLDRQETSNLTTLCTNINKLLKQTQETTQQAVNEDLSQLDEEPTAEIIQEAMDKHHIADDGGIPLFQFCINPRSFGQSVENLFYVSFLVRDGSVGVSMDSRGLPTLQSARPYAPSDAKKQGIQKHQAVFSLDFDTWRDLIDVFDIRESIIPHRDDEEELQRNRPRGWYGSS